MQSIVLFRRDFREYDQVVTVYTKDLGKQDLLARGVKKIISKNSAYLEPFSFVNIKIIKGKNLDYIGSVESLNYFKNIRQDLEKSITVNIVLSILNRAVQVEEKDERLFLLLKSWLEFMNCPILPEEGCPKGGVVGEKKDEITSKLTDAFIAKFLHLLGLGSLEFTGIIESNWDEIMLSLRVDANQSKKLHRKIYQSLVNNLEFKVKDWA